MTFSVTDKRTTSSAVAVLPVPATAVHIAMTLLFSVEMVSVYIVYVSVCNYVSVYVCKIKDEFVFFVCIYGCGYVACVCMCV